MANRIYLAANRPLLILGMDRVLLLGALVGSALIWDFTTSYRAGLVMLLPFCAMARWATKRDLKMFTVIHRSARKHLRYDPALYEDKT